MKLNSQELDLYRGILEDLHERKLNYSELVTELRQEFKVNITREEIMRLEEPTALDDAVGLKVLYRTIN